MSDSGTIDITENADLEVWDIVIIIGYFFIVMCVGLFATYKAQRGNAAGFFLAGKSMTWLPIAGSIFATNIGAPTFVGLAGSSAATGFAPVMFEWHATYMLITLGWVFVPIYISSGSYTMPEYLSKRFGGKRLRIYYAIVSLVLSILSGISAEVYAGSLFVNQILGWDVYTSTILILAVTAVYTIGGGLAAVIYTDALQAGILIIGAITVTGLALDKIGGYEAMVTRYLPSASTNTYFYQSTAGNLSCGFPPDDSFHIFRDLDSDYPWPGLTFGLTLLATYYFCTNQIIVQRNLSAKNVSHSKAACVLTSYLKILPFFLFCWPGMISRILFPEEIACSDPDRCMEICENKSGCSNIAYPLLVLNLLPTGIRGLMLAAMFAALMSSLTSQFNGASSMFTMDIWKNIRKQANEKEIVVMGRVFGLFMIGMSIAWLPILQVLQGSQLWDYLQSISAYVTPPWVVVFLLGMFWKRCTEQGAWWGLMVGFVTGMCRMGIHFAYPTPQCGSPDPDERPAVFTDVHYLHFALILGSIVLFVVVCVSFITKPRSEKQLHRVTWYTRKDYEEPELTDNDDEDDVDEPDKPKPKQTKKRKVYNWVCGFSDDPPPKFTKEEKEAMRRNLTDIKENPTASFWCDVNAVIAIGVTCFVIAFYG